VRKKNLVSHRSQIPDPDEMLFLPITTLMNVRQIAPDHHKYTMIDPDVQVQAPKKRITRHQL